jgi:hypothetical protein
MITDAISTIGKLLAKLDIFKLVMENRPGRYFYSGLVQVKMIVFF